MGLVLLPWEEMVRPRGDPSMGFRQCKGKHWYLQGQEHQRGENPNGCDCCGWCSRQENPGTGMCLGVPESGHSVVLPPGQKQTRVERKSVLR